MALRPKRPSRAGARPRIPVTFTVAFQPDEATTRVHERLGQLLADPLVLGRILRQASIEILLQAYRERFTDAMPRMTNMRRINNPRGEPNDVPESLTQAFLNAATELSAARQGGHEAGVAAAMERMHELRGRMNAALKNKNEPPHGRLGTGMKYRPLLHKVMRYLTDVSGTMLTTGGARPAFGIGPRGALDKIQTPSATPELTGHATTSELTTLWRQIEFGSGLHSVDPFGNPGSPYQMDNGGWFYGYSERFGLKLLGNSPAHVLWRATGLPYQEDEDELQARIARMIMTHLHG